MCVKLPDSAGALLAMPFAAPAGYGLGRSGWVEMKFEDDSEEPPVELLIGVRGGELPRHRTKDAREGARRSRRFLAQRGQHLLRRQPYRALYHVPGRAGPTEAQRCVRHPHVLEALQVAGNIVRIPDDETSR